jgi:hypothetical protein
MVVLHSNQRLEGGQPTAALQKLLPEYTVRVKLNVMVPTSNKHLEEGEPTAGAAAAL